MKGDVTMNFADRIKEQTAPKHKATITVDTYIEACGNAMGRVLNDVGGIMESLLPMDIWMQFFKLYSIGVRDELFGGNDDQG